MYKILPIFLLATSTWGQGQKANKDTTAEGWMATCRPVYETKAKPDGSLKLPATFDAGQCWGAFEALVAMSSWTDNGKPLLRICPPPEATNPHRWVTLFVEYLDAHPDRKNAGFESVAIAALQSAFPCR